MKRWTRLDEQILRQHAGKLCAKALAAKLGRTWEAVTQRAKILGFTLAMPQLPDHFLQTLALKHSAGWSDRDIADYCGVNLCTVFKYRTQLGLKNNRFGPRHRAKMQAHYRRQFGGHGHVSSLFEVREQAQALRAFRAGWPAGLRDNLACILEVLERGPQTRRELCAALGLTYHPCHGLKGSHGNKMLELVKLGYVKVSHRCTTTEGVRRVEKVFTLAIARRHVGQDQEAA